MAIHVDISIRSLANLRADAKEHGKSVRDFATETLDTIFNGDRSVFVFTPAVPREMLPRVDKVMGLLMNNKEVFDEVEQLIEKRMEEKNVNAETGTTPAP